MSGNTKCSILSLISPLDFSLRSQPWACVALPLMCQLAVVVCVLGEGGECVVMVVLRLGRAIGSVCAESITLLPVFNGNNRRGK